MSNADSVQQKADGKIIAAIHDQITARNQLIGVILFQFAGHGFHPAVRVQLRQCVSGGGHFIHTDTIRGMGYLSLQITQVHLIVIHQHQSTHTGSRQIHGDGGAQTTQTHYEYRCAAQRFLTGNIQLRQQYLAAVTQ